MTHEDVDSVIRRAIGGDLEARAWITARADRSVDPLVITMAALLEGRIERLERARSMAANGRDRQVVEIARAHLDGDGELVDALARDHLVDHPDTLIVAWIASDAVDRTRRETPP